MEKVKGHGTPIDPLQEKCITPLRKNKEKTNGRGVSWIRGREENYFELILFLSRDVFASARLYSEET